jgi:hypothetical protein
MIYFSFPSFSCVLYFLEYPANIIQIISMVSLDDFSLTSIFIYYEMIIVYLVFYK